MNDEERAKHAERIHQRASEMDAEFGDGIAEPPKNLNGRGLSVSNGLDEDGPVLNSETPDLELEFLLQKDPAQLSAEERALLIHEIAASNFDDAAHYLSNQNAIKFGLGR